MTLRGVAEISPETIRTLAGTRFDRARADAAVTGILQLQRGQTVGDGWLQAWSTLANLVTLPLIVGIFIVEYLVRLRLHPDFEHVSIIEGVRAFMK